MPERGMPNLCMLTCSRERPFALAALVTSVSVFTYLILDLDLLLDVLLDLQVWPCV